MKPSYNRFRRFCGFFSGAVFLLSGILKLMDPTGSGFIVKAWLDFLHIGFLSPLAVGLAECLALLEAVTGAALMSGVWRKVTAVVSFSMMGFFTVLTAVLAIANPVMDCGCFGEAVHLTHLQSLVKNLILCALLCVAFLPFRNLGAPVPIKYVSFAISVLSVLVFAVWSLIALPMKDYTAFAPGKILEASRSEDYVDLSEPVFVYEKDGEKKNFRLDNLPDSSWTFVDSKVIEDENSRRPVLSISDSDGEYCDSLAARGKVMVVSVYRKLHPHNASGVREFVSRSASAGYTPLILTCSPENLPADLQSLSRIA
ncbi:MAG: MauE/DoxX family redox-associated membrane protein, partial [Candidatus Cryptobacteroides sp.]